MNSIAELRNSVDFDVTRVQAGFRFSSEAHDFDSIITSELELDSTFEHLEYRVFYFAKRGLHENQIHRVHNAAGGNRLGWMIPANALSSAEHDYAYDQFFLRYAFAAVRESLNAPHETMLQNLTSLGGTQTGSIPFADLFHDEVSLLVLCENLLPDGFDIVRSIPGLIGQGYIQLDHCRPGEIVWDGKPFEAEDEKLLLWTTSVEAGPNTHEVSSRMMTVAASAGRPVAAQFFYLYQVVELLMDEVRVPVLRGVGQKITESLDAAEYFRVRKHLEGLGGKISESSLIKLLGERSKIDPKVLQDFQSAAEPFLHAMKRTDATGLLQLYEVRNIVVHQARNIPADAEHYLQGIVSEFATLLAQILHNFSMNSVQERG